jgi:hypothetical protein
MSAGFTLAPGRKGWVRFPGVFFKNSMFTGYNWVRFRQNSHVLPRVPARLFLNQFGLIYFDLVGFGLIWLAASRMCGTGGASVLASRYCKLYDLETNAVANPIYCSASLSERSTNFGLIYFDLVGFTRIFGRTGPGGNGLNHATPASASSPPHQIVKEQNSKLRSAIFNRRRDKL